MTEQHETPPAAAATEERGTVIQLPAGIDNAIEDLWMWSLTSGDLHCCHADGPDHITAEAKVGRARLHLRTVILCALAFEREQGRQEGAIQAIQDINTFATAALDASANYTPTMLAISPPSR